MKVRKSEIYSRIKSLPDVTFEGQSLTGFAGLVVFQKFFDAVGFKEKMDACCSHLGGGRLYRHGLCLRLLVVHVLLGFSRLRDLEAYRSDPMVMRVLGLRKIPGVATVSRLLSDLDEKAVGRVQAQVREGVLVRLEQERFSMVTLDFDGSVLGTCRHAEGSAVGFNKRKKGQRSYYPLFCTVAQTGQVLDVLHRSGNVHDSNGASEFALAAAAEVRARLPRARIEKRFDSAFFNETIIGAEERAGTEYTISVPFEAYPKLKGLVEEQERWMPVPGTGGELDCFELAWKPDCWAGQRRFLVVRKTVKTQVKGPLQLDLFEPRDFQYEYKVIVTNKSSCARKVVRFHEGRGSQEAIFGQLKSDAAMGYIPCRKWVANKIYLLCNLLAHNLVRELQMRTWPKDRGTTEKRAPRWVFAGLQTIRKLVIRRPGRLTRPKGRPTLTIGADKDSEREILNYLEVA